MYKRDTLVFCLGLAIFALIASSRPVRAASTLLVDGATTYQTIEGFGVNANYFGWNSNNDLQPALDALIDQAGMTMFRVVFNNGWETNNDNADSNLMNWNYYNSIYSAPNAQKLWGLLGYLNQKGITNGITLNFQGVGPDWMMNNTQLATGYEDEWAEMVCSLLLYARYTNHLQFSLVGPHNEPDITGEGIYIPNLSRYLTTLRDLVQKLNTNGLADMQLVVPDRSSANTNWLPEIMADSVIMSRLGHFGLHSYSDYGTGSQDVTNLLAHSAYPDRTFWMTEFNVWCSSCESGGGGTNNWQYSRGTAEYLLGHLANGASAGMVWEGYDSYYPHHGRWSLWGLLAVVNTNASPKTYTPRKGFYALAQISKFVRPGAKRVDTSGSLGALEALAFYQTNTGQITIVGENTGVSASVLNGRLTNLPPVDALEFYYTDANTNLYHSATVAVSNNTFSISVPADSVYTLVGTDVAHSTVSISITNPPEGSQFSAPVDIQITASATSTTGVLSSVVFYRNGIQIGQDTNDPPSVTWSNVPPGTYLLTAAATNSLGNYAVSSPVKISVTGPPALISVSPTNGLVVPYGIIEFTATVSDSLGTILNPPPPVSWSVNGGGAIDYDGTFVAGANIGGPYTVTASIGNLAAAANLTISSNVNLAFAGVGYNWYSLSSSNDNSPVVFEDAINDGDLVTSVGLGPNGNEDIFNAYEAAGVIWSASQRINRVVYINGAYDAQRDGVYAAAFGLQVSYDGTTWTDVPAEWTLTPLYTYNSAASAYVPFTFSGPAVTVRGVRGFGRVHTVAAPSNSWNGSVTEVQAFAAPGTPPPVLSALAATNLIRISWPAPLTNYSLQACSDMLPSSAWLPVTNVPQVIGNELRVWVEPLPGMQFFRLQKQ